MDGQMYGDVLTILGEGGYYDPLINAYYAFLAWKVSHGNLGGYIGGSSKM